jgi:hypothetical protein
MGSGPCKRPRCPRCCPYSPKCLEEVFCELRLYGVLGSCIAPALCRATFLCKEWVVLTSIVHKNPIIPYWDERPSGAKGCLSAPFRTLVGQRNGVRSEFPDSL